MRNRSHKAVDSWEALSSEIIKWADATFWRGSSSGKAKHLKEEADELLLALKAKSKRKVSNEIADIVIIAVHLAHTENIDLLKAVRHKFEIVKKRHWLPPDADGVVRHVK